MQLKKRKVDGEELCQKPVYFTTPQKRHLTSRLLSGCKRCRGFHTEVQQVITSRRKLLPLNRFVNLFALLYSQDWLYRCDKELRVHKKPKHIFLPKIYVDLKKEIWLGIASNGDNK